MDVFYWLSFFSRKSAINAIHKGPIAIVVASKPNKKRKNSSISPALMKRQMPQMIKLRAPRFQRTSPVP